MSDVNLKIGEYTHKVVSDSMNTVVVQDHPQITIKYSDDGSLVIYTRNPLHVTITDTDVVPDVCTFLKEYDKSGDEKLLSMALTNIESSISLYVSQNLFDEVSLSIVDALKNSKSIGRRQGKRDN